MSVCRGERERDTERERGSEADSVSDKAKRKVESNDRNNGVCDAADKKGSAAGKFWVKSGLRWGSAVWN